MAPVTYLRPKCRSQQGVTCPPHRWCHGVLDLRATDLLKLAIHIQIAVPLDPQEIQLLPQGSILRQLDIKATGDLGEWGGGDVRGCSVWLRPRGHLSDMGPIPNLGTLRALPSPPPRTQASVSFPWGPSIPPGSRLLNPQWVQCFRPSHLQDLGPPFPELGPMLSSSPIARVRL